MLTRVAQNNFTAGELSEWLDPRVDFPKYNNGLSVCENAIVRPQGGVFGRGGTVQVAPAKFADKTTRMVPFRFSKTTAYMIELGDKYYRIFYNYAPITIDSTITGAANNGLGQIRLTTGSAHGLTTGWAAIVEGVGGTTEANQRWSSITVIDSTHIDLDASVFTHAYTSGGTLKGVVEVATGYLAADLREIKYAQTGDVLYVVHEDYPPSKILRNSHTNWSLQVVDFFDGPYFDENTTTTTIDPAANTGTGVSVTSSAALFDPLHVGSIWRYSDTGTNWGYFEVASYISSTSITVNIIVALPGGANPPASAHWREGLWSDLQGYPAAVTMHEQRAVYGGSPQAPQTFAGSVSDSPEDMSPGVEADDAYVFTLGSGSIDSIRWMKSVENLTVGTEGNEISVTGNSDEAITPTSVRVKPRTPHGSNTVDAVRVSNATVFTQRTGRRLRALAYQIQVDQYIAKDLGLLADHILENFGLVDIAYQQERDGVCWGIRDDGTLVGVTYLPEEDVVAWHRHPTVGNDTFQSVAVIPSPQFDRDDPWLVVHRTINGVDYQFVEYMEPTNPGLDCAKIFNGAAVSTFNVPHLIGEEVTIVADGAVLSPRTVDAGGNVSLTIPASNVRIGLPFTGKIVTMKPETQLPNSGGTTQGLPRRWVQVFVRIKNTLGLNIAGEQIAYRKENSPMDTPISPVSGDIVVVNTTGFDTDGRLTIEQDVPLAWAVTGIFGKVEFGVD